MRVIQEQVARHLRLTLVRVGVRVGVGEELWNVNLEFLGNVQFPIGRDGHVSLELGKSQLSTLAV